MGHFYENLRTYQWYAPPPIMSGDHVGISFGPCRHTYGVFLWCTLALLECCSVLL